MESEDQTHRGRPVHSPEFKADVIEVCKQPGASSRLIALARGLNPSLVRHWFAPRGIGAFTNAGRLLKQPSNRSTSGFVAIKIENQRIAAPAVIRLELRRSAASVVVDWPTQEAPHIEPAHSAPHTEANVYHQLDARGARIAKDVAVVRAADAEDLYDPREQTIRTRAHVCRPEPPQT